MSECSTQNPSEAGLKMSSKKTPNQTNKKNGESSELEKEEDRKTVFTGDIPKRDKKYF